MINTSTSNGSIAGMAGNQQGGEGYGQLYTVVKDFSARLGDELTITRGDTIELISDDREYGDGWFMGKNLSTNLVGLYPKVFTKVKSNQAPGQQQPMLRSRSRRFTPQSQSAYSPTTPQLEQVPETPQMRDDDAFSRTLDPRTNSTASSESKDPAKVYSSVHRALTDIDKALEELRVDNPNDAAAAAAQQQGGGMPAPVPQEAADALDPEEVEYWTPAQVTQWFSLLGFDQQSAGQFLHHQINGAILIQMELAYLKELDISSFGVRFEMYKEIEELRLSAKRGRQNHPERTPVMNSSHPWAPNNQSPAYSHSGSPTNMRTPQQQLLQPGQYQHARKRSQSMDDVGQNIGNGHRPRGSHGSHGSHVSRSSAAAAALASPSEPTLAAFGSPINMNSNNAYRSQKSMVRPGRNGSSNSASGSGSGLGISGSGSISTSSTADDNDVVPRGQGMYESPRKAPKPPNGGPPKQAIERGFQFGDFNTLTNSDQSLASNKGGNPYAHSKKPSFEVPTLDPSRLRSTSTSLDQASSVYAPVSRGSSFSFSASTPSRKSGGDLKTSMTKSASAAAGEQTPSTDSTSPIDDSKRNTQSSSSKASSKTTRSPERRTVSAKETNSPKGAADHDSNGKRAFSATAALRSLYRPAKTQTSAFQEGIREITPKEAAKDCEHSGWMFKKGNMSIGSWKQRFFVLNKTRLAYFTSLKDTKEKGMIDLTSHRVVTATEEGDKLASMYAATAGFGRYCFKLVPPAPGSRKGLTFTQQKVHYFAVDTEDEMRGWMSALMRATIELDESVPVISSCVTPTIPLQKAQELLKEARVNARANLEALQRERETQGGSPVPEPTPRQSSGATTTRETIITGEIPMDFRDVMSSDTTQATQNTEFTQNMQPFSSSQTTPSSMSGPRMDGKGFSSKPTSPSVNGMSTPYLLTSGLMSPHPNSSPDMRKHPHPPPIITKLDEPEHMHDEEDASSHGSSSHVSTPLMSVVGTMGRRVMSLRKSKDGPEELRRK